MRRNSLSIVDLFAGAGGFSRGFKEAGYRILAAVDNDRAAATTYAANFPQTLTVVEDVRRISCETFKKFLNEPVKVLIGSPPCEPYTGANPNRWREPLKRLYEDLEGRLVLEFVRFVDCLHPEAFVMENVPALINDGLREALIQEFMMVGYEVFLNILRAEDYGTPSRRTRVFVSNIKLSLRKEGKRISVAEALNGLPPPSPDPAIPNHEPPPNLSRSKFKRAVRAGWGSSIIRFEGVGGKLIPNLIRLHPKKVAPTVLGASRFIHPYENRLLTVREQARLMGFPDSHIFYGGRNQQYNQVGEAVPPPLARAIAEYVKNFLGGG